MFNSLKSFMFGGTAGSVAASRADVRANNSAVQPEMQRMMRTKRKRDSDDGEPLAKKAKVDNAEATTLTPASDAVFAAVDNVSSSETPSSKRRRSSTSTADNTPLKRMRRDENGLVARPSGDDTQSPQRDELDDLSHGSTTATSPFDLLDEDAVASDNDSGSSQWTEDNLGDEVDVVAGDLATGLVNIVQQYRAATSGVSHGLLSSTSYNTSKRLRRQAKKYNKDVKAQQNDHEAIGSDEGGEVESLYGIGSWPGSSAVPGSLRQEPHDARDRMEMPPRKPHLVDWGQFVGQEKPSWAKHRRAACEAQLPPSQTAE